MATATENADGEAAQPQIILVQHWFEELRLLVPTNCWAHPVEIPHARINPV